VDSRLKDLRARKEEALHAGSQDAVSRQHDRGKMTARARVEELLDPGSFQETDLLARHRSTEADRKAQHRTQLRAIAW